MMFSFVYLQSQCNVESFVVNVIHTNLCAGKCLKSPVVAKVLVIETVRGGHVVLLLLASSSVEI